MVENLSNEELFRRYDVELVLRHLSPKSLNEARRIIGHLRIFLGDDPPSSELAKGYLRQFVERKPRTQERYAAELRSFMNWYGEPFDLKVRLPRSLPKYVFHDAVMRLLDAISRKSSHKRTMVRDCLVVELAYYAGLRRGEMANLTVGEIRFAEGFVTVRKGKGQKDRVVPLTKSLAAKLEIFCRDMTPNQKVLGLKEATITNKIAVWSKKAGVELTCHSLRHGFATRLLEKGADIRQIQALLGHESLNTTQIYANLAPGSLRQAIDLLDEPVPESRSIQADQGSLDGGSRPFGPSVAVDGGLHHRELVYFGLCLRDRLSLCLPYDSAECVCGDSLLMWRGRPGPAASRRGGQESVDGEWTVGRYDASTHSLFDWFRAHLADHPCWEVLDEVASGFRNYVGACQRAYTAALEDVKSRSGHLKDSDARGLADSKLQSR